MFKIFISKKGYNEKPSEKDSKVMNINRERTIKEIALGNWKPHEVNLDYIARKIGEGHSINATVTDTTKLLILDIDNGIDEVTFCKYLKKIDMIPNIYYRTFSFNKDLGKYKMRCIYVLDKEYTLEQYKAIYKMLEWYFPKYTNGEGKEKSVLDMSLSNFKQLVHGTNKEVKLIHYRAFEPRAFARNINYKAEVKKVVKLENVKPGNYTKGTFNLESVLEHFNIKNLGLLDYHEGYNFYLALRPFNLEHLLKLKEEHQKKFEQAFLKGYKSERGHEASKLFGALNKLKLEG